MIEPRTAQAPHDVAGHYDELDPIYRAVWGEHVHHGLWTTGRETVEQATDALSLAVAGKLGLNGGEALVDIGCGYGGTAALFARRFDSRVTGFSLSTAQIDVARARCDPRLTFHRRDALRHLHLRKTKGYAMILYGSSFSPFVRKVLAFAAERGVMGRRAS